MSDASPATPAPPAEPVVPTPPDSAASCSIELYKRTVPGRVRISYWVAESDQSPEPAPNPVDIISWDQTYYLYVMIRLADPIRRHLCGKLCVDVDIDTCGPAPDIDFPEKSVDLDPCGPGVYVVRFELPPDTFRPVPPYDARCGRVYRLCLTVGSRDACDHPGLIWGHCSALELAVHPPVAP